MEFVNGQDRVLYVKINGNWLPIGCLTDNSMDETAELLDTTTRDNQGWTTSRPIIQSYNIGFNGLQLNTTIVGGDFTVTSYDKLKQLKRDKVLIDWKLEGILYKIVDYGKGYISSISETNVIDEFMSFNGSITGFGKPLMTEKGTNVLNSGNPNEVINNGDPNVIIKTEEI